MNYSQGVRDACSKNECFQIMGFGNAVEPEECRMIAGFSRLGFVEGSGQKGSEVEYTSSNVGILDTVGVFEMRLRDSDASA